MKFLLILAGSITLTTATCFAQAENANIPVDKDTKLITYTEVVPVNNVPKDSLYNRASGWFQTYFKNPGEVIKQQNPEEGTITGVHRFKLSKEVESTKKEKGTVKNDAGFVSYTVSIMCKDNKFKYELTKINWKQQSYFPIEKWMDRSSKSFTPDYDNFLAQTDEYMKKLAKDIKEGMTQEAKKKKADW
jgi:hypothetical protein